MKKDYISTTAICAILIMLLVWLGISVNDARHSAGDATCVSHLKMIGIALENYQREHGSSPPIFVTDAEGKPMHSWRVLILPYLGRQDIYAQYNFNEPWNSASNRRLALQMPNVYRCPMDPSDAKTTTSYVAVVDPQYSPKSSSQKNDIDSTFENGKLFMVAEVADSNIDWMEPRDIGIDDAVRGINTEIKPCICSHHPHWTNYYRIDGSVERLDNDTSHVALDKLLRISPLVQDQQPTTTNPK
jgi:hypothetical protein